MLYHRLAALSSRIQPEVRFRLFPHRLRQKATHWDPKMKYNILKCQGIAESMQPDFRPLPLQLQGVDTVYRSAAFRNM